MTGKLNINLGELVSASHGTLMTEGSESCFDTIFTDSRSVEPGRKNIFVPLNGESFDGHNFIEPLCADGKISAFFTERESDVETAEKYGIASVRVENTLYALGAVAAWHRKHFDPYMIGITGTNGKTTTKELVSCIFSSVFRTHRNEKNYNNEIGVPFSLLSLGDEHEYSVIEMGMNHAGEIARLSAIVRPDLSIITNAGEGHLEFLQTVENVATAKSEIFSGMVPGARVLLNSDSAFYGLMKDNAESRRLNVMSFGIENKADFMPSEFSLGEDSCSITLGDSIYSVQLYGFHNLYNLLAAVSAAAVCGISPARVSEALKNFRNADKRSQIINGTYTVINDTYNSNPLSLKSALVSMKHIYNGRRKIAVLADMKELGKEESRFHLAAGRQVFENGFALLYTWGEQAENISQGALGAGMDKNCVKHFTHKHDLVREVSLVLEKDDVILVKGSRSMKMEEVTDSLVR